MKKVNRAFKSSLDLPAIKLEGILFLPDQLEKAALGKSICQTEKDYQVPAGLKIKDEYSRAFQIARALWRKFSLLFERQGVEPLDVTQAFMKSLLKDALGYHNISTTTHLVVNEYTYKINFIADNVPVVVAPFDMELDESSELFSVEGSGSRSKTAFQLAQEFLNADGNYLWAFVTNGRQVRLLRDAESLTRPSFLEIDLEDILEGQRFSEFATVWRLLHASRSPQSGQPNTQCIWEQWREHGVEEGTRVRDGLRYGVEQALITLGTGFLKHPDNDALRTALHEGELSKEAYFQQLLRLVYRLIFVFTLEERGLLHPQSSTEAARHAYAHGYALARLRDLCLKRRLHNHFTDQWQATRIIFKGLQQGEPRLALPALGGLFAAEQTPHLDTAQLTNNEFLLTIRHLRWAVITQGRVSNTTPVDYRNMGPEELGSVYESLLELVPEINLTERQFGFVGFGAAWQDGTTGTAGNTRKLTGSYYTPDSLVQELIKSALEPVIAQRLAEAPETPTEALLNIKVVDPACGSGHFLLAAARRLAEELAQLRNQEQLQEGAIRPQDYRHALREVISRCIYGVDRNPMAIELARMALWLEGFEEGRPLNFLDHHLQVGDALLGMMDLSLLDQGISNDAFKVLTGDCKDTASALRAENRDALKQLAEERKSPQFRLPLEQANQLKQLAAIEAMPQNTVAEIAAQESAYQQFLESTKNSPLRHAADMLVGAFLLPKTTATQQQVPTTANLIFELFTDAAQHSSQHKQCREAATKACKNASVFHWPLAFPQVFAAGGFDCVLGNPPWEVTQMGEVEFFATRAPEIAALAGAQRKRAIANLETVNPQLWDEFSKQSHFVAAVNSYIRNSSRFPLTAHGKLNTYALFSESIYQMRRNTGTAGFIVKSGIATDYGNRFFFAEVMQEKLLNQFLDFENREKLFPAVDSREKFCLITLAKSEQAEFIFFATKTSQLTDSRRRFTLSPEEFVLINPNTLTCPVFRSKQDAELTKKLYQAAPVLIKEEVKIGSKIVEPEVNPWGITFGQGLFNMTSDSHLFQLKDRANLLPLYEAKLIHHFDHRFATYIPDYSISNKDWNSRDITSNEKRDLGFSITPRYWVDKAEVKAKLKAREWDRDWLMGFRKTARNTDERTVITAVLPSYAVGDKLPLFFFEKNNKPEFLLCLLANLNNFVLDFAARQKVGGTDISHFYIKQFPVIPPEAYTQADLDFIIPRVLELTYTSHELKGWAQDLGYEGEPFVWDEERRALLRAELDAYYAKLYGLTRDELRYILDPADVMGEDYPTETFRVLKNKELREYGEYRTQRLVLEAWDRLESGELK